MPFGVSFQEVILPLALRPFLEQDYTEASLSWVSIAEKHPRHTGLLLPCSTHRLLHRYQTAAQPDASLRNCQAVILQ